MNREELKSLLEINNILIADKAVEIELLKTDIQELESSMEDIKDDVFDLRNEIASLEAKNEEIELQIKDMGDEE